MGAFKVQYFTKMKEKQVAILHGDNAMIQTGQELTYDDGRKVKISSVDSKYTPGSGGVLLIGDIDTTKNQLFY